MLKWSLRSVALGSCLAFTLACAVSSGKADKVDLEDCQGNADVDDVTRIAYDAEDSLHEMVVCGQLSRELASALSQSIQSLLGDPVNAPKQFDYVGEGIWRIENDQLTMDLWVEDKGEIVQANLLDPSDFFTNLRLDTEGLNVVLRFDEAGPLAFLLGGGKNPSSPLKLDPLQVDDAIAAVGDLKIAGLLVLEDKLENGTVIAYDLSVPSLKLSALVGFTPMEYEIESLGGGRKDLDQSLETLLWDVAFVDDALDGTVELAFVGGPFDFQGQYVYTPEQQDPVISLTCLDEGGDGTQGQR